MANPFETIKFKFKWVDEHANETGILKKKGSFDGETLKLDETEIPADSIFDLVVRDRLMMLGVPTSDGKNFTAVLSIYNADVERLRRAINGSRSKKFAEQERIRLQNEGRGSKYRDHNCPFCDATILLTGKPETPQVYCEFCDTLFTAQHVAYDTGFEADYRLCDECGMYSNPSKFTIFYFYFLVVVSGWHVNRTTRCPACMRPDAWRMLFGNIFGLIGIPIAIVQLVRAYSGRRGSGPLVGLDDANILANKEKIEEALSAYDAVMDNVPINAGVKYNIAKGLIKKKDLQHAEAMFRMSLEDCSNYGPALRGMIEVLDAQDRNAEVLPFLDQYGHDRDSVLGNWEQLLPKE